MNKKILLTLLILLSFVITASAVSASDANVTDSYATSLVDDTSDVSVPLENTADSSEISVSSDSNVDNDSSKVSLSSEEVLESENSNTLSTDSASNDSLGSDSGIAVVSSSQDDVVSSDVSSKIDSSKTITAKDITKYYKGSTQYTATFLDDYGKPLANTDVKITVNGVAYTKKTNANGVASLAINLKPGTYKVVAVNPATGYSLTKTFKILSTITASDISKVYTDGRKFSAKFYKSNGKVLANKNVKFKINGKTYKVKTNSKGVASLSLKTLKKGTYKIISYNTDGLTKTNKVTVVKSVATSLTTSAYTFLKSDSKTIKVKLLNKFGYAPSKGKVIKIKINGKTYSKKTNANGIASLKLPTLKKGSYTVKYSFAGNGYYKKSSASNKVVIITTKTPTLTVKSGTTFTYGASTFKVAATAGGVPLYKKTITFTVDGKTYKKTTDAKGIASLSAKWGVGKHSISYSIAKDSKINAKTGSSTITIKSAAKHNAYWVYGEDMKSVNLKDLSSKGITDIFLNFKAYDTYGKSGVESWISAAKTNGINVHMWVQAFHTQDDGWVNPVKNGKENTAQFTKKINEIKTYAALKGLYGIHLDYLRYSGDSSSNNAAYQNSGGTAAITSFTNQAIKAAKAINSNLIMSGALMPETSSSAKYYGQDYDALSKSLDVVIPMVYKGNYNKDSSWITSTTKWYVANSKGAEVWTGIQTYKSDKDTIQLSASDLSTDIKAAFSGGAAGVVLFRYGISNNVNFNSLSTNTASAKTISIKNVVTGATNVKTFYDNNNRLPNTVTIGGYEFTLSEFLYVMSQAIYQIGTSNTNDISIITGVLNPTAPSGDTISSKQLVMADYLTVAKNVANFISTNKYAPNYASSAVGKIIYSELVDSFSRILKFYGTNSDLPSYVTVTYTPTSSGSSSSTTTASGTGLNEKNTITDLTPYLKSTTNCQVNSDSIKKVVKSLTSSLTSNLAKAKAIFNYVRDTLSYSFYYNTKYGATGTLSAKAGNCVDHSHLLVAMFRTAGLAARYVHGTCKFSSGSTYGHVWAQVLVDGKWYVADATSSKNSLGSVSNWNTNSFSLNKIYASLPF